MFKIPGLDENVNISVTAIIGKSCYNISVRKRGTKNFLTG